MQKYLSVLCRWKYMRRTWCSLVTCQCYVVDTARFRGRGDRERERERERGRKRGRERREGETM
jgi:hypothetical protein